MYIYFGHPEANSVHMNLNFSFNSNLMASSSSSLPRTWRYHVFTSFHGSDVRKTFLSHLRKQFNCNGITMFDDQGIEKSQTIAPALTQAIRESRIAIVVLSKNYASSSWCLDELLEIFKCKEIIGQIVMTIFYGVDPSDVRKQTRDFGIAFNGTCALKTEDERRRWSQALTDAGNIAGVDFQRCDNEAEMIEKIAKDVSEKLNATPSKDFDGMVGLEAHLREMESLLELDYDGVKMVGISGPAGIGKTTIARALQSRLSKRFQLTCFVDNLKGSYHSGIDDYGLQLCLQEQLLSKVLNQDGMRLCHLGVLQKRLSALRVFIVLDDVNDVKQLEALAKKTTWFGPGTRIVATTENKDLLRQRGINNMYYVKFPSKKEALEILCRYAFEQNSPVHGFKELSERITELCGRLPLGLRVVGSSLREKEDKDEWKDMMSRLETILDRDIEDVLRVGYDSLEDNEKTLFLHLAVFFNYRDGDLMEAMFADSGLDLKCGLNILENRSRIEKTPHQGKILIHRLLEQMGKKVIHKQEPWKRKILIDATEICDILEHAKGTSEVSGISFDTSGVTEVCISDKAFKRMRNLRFLRVYKSRDDGNYSVQIPEEMELPRRLRLLDWEGYPSKSLPPTFHPEYLVKLHMEHSKLEKLWDGIQPLTSLKEIDLSWSLHLKELPDLSKATNLELLDLSYCQSLVELPSSFSNLHKLKTLWMTDCLKLEVIPTNWNLASLENVIVSGCSRLPNFPCISTNTNIFTLSDTAVRDVPASFTLWSQLTDLEISGHGMLKTLPQLPTNITWIRLSNNGLESISNCCIEDLRMLRELTLSGCRKLTSLPELPYSLEVLDASDCELLETVCFPFNLPKAELIFTNCFKLDQQARRSIIQDSFFLGLAFLPGREVPAEFDHRAEKGNTLTFPLPAFSSFKVCLVLSPNQLTGVYDFPKILCRRIRKGYLYPVEEVHCQFNKCRRKHLFIFHSEWLYQYRWLNVSSDIMFEFSSTYQDFDIIECGAQILTHDEEETSDGEDDEEETSDEEDDEEGYESESGEAYKDKDEDLAEGDYETVSRKRPMKATMTSDSTNMKWEMKRRRS